MKKVILIEDEHLAVEELTKMIQLLRPEYEIVKTLDTIAEAVIYFDTKPNYDLIFCDVELADGNSFELLKRVEIKKPIIFSTAYQQYALEAFGTSAIAYLLKPFSMENLLHAIEKFEALYSPHLPEKENFMIVNVEYKMIKIHFSDILYLESIDDYVKIHLENQKPVMTAMSLKKMIQKLPADLFIRIHRSYIVPLDKIEAVRNKKVLVCGKELPVGATYEDKFAQFSKFGKY